MEVSLNVGCLPYAVKKQMSIPSINRVPTNLESQGESGNLSGQGKSGKSQGILDGVREKE